jgi:hypothetical protein
MNTSVILPTLELVGFYPILHVLKEEHEAENYENCIELRAVLENFIKETNNDLSTKIDEDSMQQTYNKILKKNPHPQFIHEAMPKMIELAKKLLNSKPKDVIFFDFRGSLHRIKINE